MEENTQSKVGTFLSSAVSRVISIVMILIIIALVALVAWFWHNNELLEQKNIDLQDRMNKFEEMNVLSISVGDSIAVEKGRWSVSLYSGGILHGEYLTEWRRTDKKWQIVNDISVAD